MAENGEATVSAVTEAAKPYVVGVVFEYDLQPHRGWKHNPRKEYLYRTDIPNIVVGDTVVVVSPTTGNTCVKVVAVYPDRNHAGYKWVVDKVDESGAQRRAEAKRRAAHLRKELNTRIAEAQNTMLMSFLEANNPEIRAMREELQQLEELIR